MHWNFLNVIFMTTLTHTHATDYCKFIPSHILCGSLSFSPQCGEIIDRNTKVPKEMQKRIVKAFNEYRNLVAGGGVSVIDGLLPQAANIVELVWDDEMAAIAEAYTMKCNFEHSCDKCRQVERFGSGESLFLGESSDNAMLNFTWEETIQQWTVHEQQFLFVEDTIYIQRINKGGFSNTQWGHMIQAIWADTKYVGCGKIIYRPHPNSWLSLLAVCTFGPYGVIKGAKTYIWGKPCSLCPCDRKCSTTYPNLCSPESGEDGKICASGPQIKEDGILYSSESSSNCIRGITCLLLFSLITDLFLYKYIEY